MTQFLYMIAAAMLGHFVGDYTFQNQWMAIGKSGKGWHGHLCCTVHVALYTLAVALFTGWHPLFLAVVAVPHWIIDRWSIATYIMRLKNGFWPFTETWKASSATAESLADPAPAPTPWANAPISAPLIAAVANDSPEIQLNVWKVAFAAPVYIFNDNVLHWVCLWFTCKYFFGS